MAHQPHSKPQRRRQSESPQEDNQKPTEMGNQNQPDTNLHWKQLCAVVLIHRTDVGACIAQHVA
jgi:hypothetical protein